MSCSKCRGSVHVNRVGKHPVFLGGYRPRGTAAKMSDRGNRSGTIHVTAFIILFRDAWARRNQTTELQPLHALALQPPALMHYAYSP